MYNLTNELKMDTVRWPLIFSIARGLRLLHDVNLLPKPQQHDEYAKELWATLITVLDQSILTFAPFTRSFLFRN